MASSTFSLSPATGASSRQIVVHVEEGVPSVIKGRDLVQTALYSTRGTACRLRLVGWSECRDRITESSPDALSLIYASTSSSGNASLMPLCRDAGQTFHAVDPSDVSQGSNSIIVSSSYQSEDVTVHYDPSTFSRDTYVVPALEVKPVVVCESSTLADFGVPSGASWGISAADAGFVLARDTATNFRYLCVREHSELDRILTNARTLSGATSTRRPDMGALTLRVSTVAPSAGVSWNDVQEPFYTDVNVYRTAPVSFLQTSTVAGVTETDELATMWKAYQIGADSWSGLLRILYTSNTGSVVAGDSSSRLRCVSVLYEKNHPRTVKLLFNAEAMAGATLARNGGVYGN